jgi:cation-transporting ATPase E
VVVLIVPATHDYFGLTAPDPPVLETSGVAVVGWFVVLSLIPRLRVLERLLGLRT